jgi:hypothetical protein
MADGGSRMADRLSVLILAVLVLLFVPGAAMAQRTFNRALLDARMPAAAPTPLKTCDKNRETVAVVEDKESAARLMEVGLASGISPVVQDVLRRSGCFSQDPIASMKFQVSVMNVSNDPSPLGIGFQGTQLKGKADVRLFVVDVSVRMANDEWTFEARGRGEVLVQIMLTSHIVITPPGVPVGEATKADAYAAALTFAVEDAVNNLIEVHDRATSH